MGKTKSPTIKLKVTEALSKDMGRAYARMGPEDLEDLGASIGDIVEVTGKRTTVCQAMPAYKECGVNPEIQLDGLSQAKCKSGYGRECCSEEDLLPPCGTCGFDSANVTPSERDLEYIGEPFGRTAYV